MSGLLRAHFHLESNSQCRLGCAAIFLIGGPTRDTEPIPILLRSGDLLIMSGPCRRAYHGPSVRFRTTEGTHRVLHSGVPRVFEGTCPSHLMNHSTCNLDQGGKEDWQPYAEYLTGARINVNVRQVFPKNFDPELQQALETMNVNE